jgi:hypothetical protein
MDVAGRSASSGRPDRKWYVRFLWPSAAVLLVALVGDRGDALAVLRSFGWGALMFGIPMTLFIALLVGIHQWRVRTGRAAPQTKTRHRPRGQGWLSGAILFGVGMIAYAGGGAARAAFIAGGGPGVALCIAMLHRATGIFAWQEADSD